MFDGEVTAVRNDRVISLAVSDLQIGDIVLIQTGEVVPADLKVLEASDLVMDEFELTGEIMPVEKHVFAEGDTLVFEGSTVLHGHGKGIVIATGENTEYGKVLKQSSQYAEVENLPFFRKRYLLALLFLAPALLVRFRAYEDHELIYIMYGLLALSFLLVQSGELLRLILVRQQKKKLLKHNIFLRGNAVVEEMGKVDLFCFDKTGVLTSRDIKVKQVFIGGETSTVDVFNTRDNGTWNLIKTGCALCNDLAYHEKTELAGPIDRALMSYAEEHGTKIEECMSRHQRIYQKPFNSEDRYVACGFTEAFGRKPVYFAKGDPEVILKMCSDYMTGWGERRSLGSYHRRSGIGRTP